MLGVRGDIVSLCYPSTEGTPYDRRETNISSIIEEQLMLGGKSELSIITQTDAALGTGPKRRSVIVEFTVLGEEAGAIHVKVTATQPIPLSFFEAELCGTEQAFEVNEAVNDELASWDLEGVTMSIKTSVRVGNTLN